MVEHEYGIVGAILMDSDCITKIYDMVSPEMFTDTFLGETYRTMRAEYDLGNPVNVATIMPKLINDIYDESYVGETLKTCITNTISSTYVTNFAETLSTNYKCRVLTDLINNVRVDPNNLDSVMADISANIEALQTEKKVEGKSAAEISELYMGEYFKERKGAAKILTGIFKLDDCLGGLEPGDVTVVGARPAVGKSAFVTQLAEHVASQGHKVGYFNLEMTEKQMYERFIAKMSGIELTRIRRAMAFLGDEKEKFYKANEKFSKYKLKLFDGSKTVSQIRNLSRHQDFDIIIIDYLQLLKTDRNYQSRAAEVGDISKSIKALAMELKVPIIVLSQLNRTSEMNETKEPTMSELRESGDIEQDASNIILLWNLSDSHKFKGIKVEKQRQGDLMKDGLEFDGARMTFSERNGDFNQFMSYVKTIEKGSGYAEDNPFD